MTAETKMILPSPRLPLRSRLPSPDFGRGAGGEGKIQKTLTQAFRYALVGVSNTLIDAATYYTLTRALGLATLPVLAKGLAYAIGMTNSFYWNRTWTFRAKDTIYRVPIWLAAFLFTLTHIVALGINAGVMALSLNLLHVPEIVALILATAAAFGWNFFLNKWVVFK